MTTQDILELAARCEASTGSDRELDRLIEHEVAPERIGHIELPLLAYTASLDAAMTLVPEGFHLFSLGEGRYMTRQPAFCAQLEIWTSENGIDGSEHRSIGVAATPALALTAAALKARAHTKGEE